MDNKIANVLNQLILILFILCYTRIDNIQTERHFTSTIYICHRFNNTKYLLCISGLLTFSSIVQIGLFSHISEQCGSAADFFCSYAKCTRNIQAIESDFCKLYSRRGLNSKNNVCFAYLDHTNVEWSNSQNILALIELAI